jgi:hypothetical protein
MTLAAVPAAMSLQEAATEANVGFRGVSVMPETKYKRVVYVQTNCVWDANDKDWLEALTDKYPTRHQRFFRKRLMLPDDVFFVPTSWSSHSYLDGTVYAGDEVYKGQEPKGKGKKYDTLRWRTSGGIDRPKSAKTTYRDYEYYLGGTPWLRCPYTAIDGFLFANTLDNLVHENGKWLSADLETFRNVRYLWPYLSYRLENACTAEQLMPLAYDVDKRAMSLVEVNEAIRQCFKGLLLTKEKL